MHYIDNKLTILGEIMKINYDLHMHTALSPCAMDEMTPNNIVNMSLISELDVIAITDHNSCENVQAVLDVASGTDLIVIPGIEVETMEEIHVVCLFETIEHAYGIQDEVYRRLPPKKNNAKIFGEQTLLNNEDDTVGQVERLLSFATSISIDELVVLVAKVGGVCIPAHVDRPSYSLISNLGMIPEHLSFPVLEISRFNDLADYIEKYKDHFLIQSSDAHELGVIGSCGGTIEVARKSVHEVIQRLKHVM